MTAGEAHVRVHVDGSHHPIHDHATGVVVTLTYATGEVAEVQVSKVGYGLRVVMAGEADTGGLDSRGHPSAMVYPVAKGSPE